MSRYFRNKQDIKHIEADTLWKLNETETMLILVDEDDTQLVPYEQKKEYFYEVDRPDELR